MIQVCQLGAYFFDAPIQDLYICSDQLLVFDWRRTLDLAFGPLHYAQKKSLYRLKIEDDAEEYLIKRFGGKITVTWTEREIWVSQYGDGKLQRQIVNGYVARLRRSHANAGRLFRIYKYEDNDGISVSFKRANEDHMDCFRKSRNEYIFGRFIREHNKQMLPG